MKSLSLLKILINVLPDKLLAMVADDVFKRMRKQYLIDSFEPQRERRLRLCFNKFKSDIKKCYAENEKEKTLDMTSYDMESLLQSGYMDRKLVSFIFSNRFTQKEIDEFYHDECSHLKMETVGPVHVSIPDPTVDELIDSTKREAVKCILWHELVLFFALLKGEIVSPN